MKMKKFVVLAVAFLAIGCASMDKEIHAKSTSELKLRHTQLVEEIAQPRGWSFDRFGGGSENRKKQIKEKEKIELELLHRYQSGDKAAYLPSFRE
jgi:starvation-inducible outer membrane lipoprotein